MSDKCKRGICNNGPVYGQNNAEHQEIEQNIYINIAASPVAHDTLSQLRWNVPYQRNPYFTGREDLLVRLHEQLHAGQATALSQAISGLGGVGKTQLAVEYAYRHQEEYHYILWVHAESQESLISSYVSLAHLLNLPQRNEQNQNVAVQAVKNWLQNNSGWLLIFDNADEPKALPSFVPASPKGHCLYTTRASTLGRLALSLTVECFTDEQGAIFLLHRAEFLKTSVSLEHANPQDRELALQLASELGGLPLALDQAGAYINETQMSLADYIVIYQEHRMALFQERRSLLEDHPAPVATTWFISFDRIKQCSSAAEELLHLLAFLAPDDVPEEMLIKSAEHLGSVLGPTVTDTFRFNQALEALLAYSLVRRDREKKLLSIHRLVQAVIRDVMSVEERRMWIKRAVLAVNETFPDPEFANWQACEYWQPHTIVCATWAEQEELRLSEVALMFNQLAAYLTKRSRYSEALPLYIRAWEINERELGLTHPTTTTIVNNLAMLFYLQGEYKQAEDLLRSTLTINEHLFGPESLPVAANLNNLAILCNEQRRYDEAEILLVRAISIRERILGLTDPNTIISLNNLALSYKGQGKLEAAMLLQEQVLEVSEQQLKSSHPDKAAFMNNLGAFYYDQGKYKEAEPLLIRALEINKYELGLSHPNTALNQNNLARLYIDQGRYKEAEPLLLQALEVYEDKLGLYHNETMVCQDNLFRLYFKQNRLQDAEKLIVPVLAAREKMLGELHVGTAGCLNDLALLYEKQGKQDDAEQMFMRSLAIYESLLEPEHQETQTVRNNFNAFQNRKKRNKDVEQLERQKFDKLRGKQKKKARQRDNRLKPQ